MNKELQDQVARYIKAIDESELSEKTKLLTICLSKALGVEVVQLGITQLGSEISILPPARSPPAPQEDG